MSKTNKSVSIDYGSLEFMSLILVNMKIEDKGSFARRRFFRLINPLLQDLEAERNILKEKYCEKDKDKKPIIIDKNYTFSSTNRRDFNLAIQKLSDEKVNLDKNESNLQDFSTIKGILKKKLEEVEEKMKGQYSASDYEQVSALREIISIL